MKIFEDYFSEYQADMVSICLEYVNQNADYIYIYASCESGMIYGDCFFNIDGKVIERNNLNEEANNAYRYDTSEDRQKMLLNIISEDIERIYKLCTKYKREMPTEIKLVYDVKKNSLTANYVYENLWTDSDTKLGLDIFNDWFEEIKEKSCPIN